MSHKPKTFANSPSSKGRSKKQRPKLKETITSAVKERPPTRRHPPEVLTNRDATSACKGKHCQCCVSDKYKTTYLGLQTPRQQSQMDDAEQHEYLQFSLHITEEMIRNDMFKNEEMIQVLKKHYQANKSRLNQELLLKTIAKLCSELNIPINDDVMSFLEDQSTNFKADTDTNSENGIHPESPFVFKTSQLMITSSGQADMTANSLGIQIVDSEDATSKQQPTMPNEDLNDTNVGNVINVVDDDFVREQSLQQALEEKAFEFGEETLTAPGEESIPSLHMKMKIKDLQEFTVLHDATARFARESDKESDASLAQTVSPSSTIGHLDNNNRPGLVVSLEKHKKREKNLVIAHYSTSIEPLMIQTKEFSTQATLDSNIDVVNFDVPVVQVDTGLNDATTQKSVSVMSDQTGMACQTVNLLVNQVVNEQVDTNNGNSNMKPPDVKHLKCLSCNCEERERIDKMLVRLSSDDGDGALIENESPHLIMDCPVLIPRDQALSAKRFDMLSSLANGEKFEKNFDAMNIRMPPSFLPNNSMCNMDAGDLVVGGIHNNDYYDLTPQKDKVHPVMVANRPPSMGRTNHVIPKEVMSDKLEQFGKTDRIDRYKKVNEYLSLFYPTIATQVSSMDLLSTEVYPRQQYKQFSSMAQYEQRYKAPQHIQQQYQCQQVYKQNPLQQQQQQQQFQMQQQQQQLHETRHQSSRNCDRYDQRNYAEFGVAGTESVPDFYPSSSNQSVEVPVVSNYKSFNKTSTPMNKNKVQRAKLVTNLDNYKINQTAASSSAILSSSHFSHKKHYGDGVNGDTESVRSPGQSRAISPDKSALVYPHSSKGCPDSEDDMSVGKTLQIYHSNDSMEQRIMSLRHDIEKYSKDDITLKRTGADTPKRGDDLMDILRKNSYNGLSSEGSVLKPKKMSILRKHNKDK